MKNSWLGRARGQAGESAKGSPRRMPDRPWPVFVGHGYWEMLVRARKVHSCGARLLSTIVAST